MYTKKAPCSIFLCRTRHWCHPLAAALNVAIDEGTYNGHLKEVVGSLVNVVRYHGLCVYRKRFPVNAHELLRTLFRTRVPFSYT